MQYQAPANDLRFLLFDVLGADKLHELEKYADATPDLISAVIDEAGKLAAEVIQPTNQVGDRQGCSYDPETKLVKTPDGFKAAYDKFVEGGWTALDAPIEFGGQGLIRTRATPNDDGSYAIEGTKIWITGGEHDLVDNIVHLVLAKLPGAPDTTKGISLFVVPKFLPDSGERNPAFCGGLEHKMGIKGSATRVMNFEGAKGWLVGEPNKGMRALALFTGHQLDLSVAHPDEDVRENADDLVQLLTPVVKAFLTDEGYNNANWGQQVLGGSGFTQDWPLEQLVRDGRIARIYEGTNGIQAMDLVGRKLSLKGGQLVRALFAELTGYLKDNPEAP